MYCLGSCFSGQGLGDFGFYLGGWEISWQIEIEKYDQKILNLRWPESKKYGDIKKVRPKELAAVDLVWGGFPCQPFSCAGKRRGKDDDRNLWPEMRRIIFEVKPPWVVIENVPGIVGIMLEEILDDLENEGYEAIPFIFPAHALGAPHKRERIWIIAYSPEQRQRRRKGNNYTGDLPENIETRKEARSEVSRHFRFWESEPGVGRVVNGMPHRVDRLRGLGNGVVVQVAYFIGKMIIKWEEDNIKQV